MLFLVLCLDLVGTHCAELTAAVSVPAVLSRWPQMWLLWLDHGSCCYSHLRSHLFPELITETRNSVQGHGSGCEEEAVRQTRLTAPTPL